MAFLRAQSRKRWSELVRVGGSPWLYGVFATRVPPGSPQDKLLHLWPGLEAVWAWWMNLRETG